MQVDLKAVEQLAPDQASLRAAVGLAKAGTWSSLGSSPDGGLIWAECWAGWDTKFYRVVADLRHLGNKCTCPSRKHPCRHVLALLWLNAEGMFAFPPAETPDWVGKWVEMPDDPKAAARREATAVKRADDTDRAVLDVLEALEQWIGDQLRTGLATFIDDVTARCRKIALRLVDGKAAALAHRIEELPSRLLALPAADRPRGAVVELGKLVLLGRGFRMAPRDADIRRAVAGAETREAVLGNSGLLRARGIWEVLAELVRTHHDGRVWRTNWLLNLDGTGPRFAMLLDQVSANPGRREAGLMPGERFVGELAFFPARNPLRALLVEREPIGAEREFDWPEPESALSGILTEPLLAEPWALDVPVLLPAGRLAIDAAGQGWWRACGDDAAVPLAEAATGLIRSTELTRAAALWSGNRLSILAARTRWGRISSHG